MTSIHTEASRVIDAPPQDVYAVIADYRVGHPAILPKPYFSELTVEQGGVGAGTVIRFSMTVMGDRRDFRAVVTEPEPGRALVETDHDAGVVTTFTVEPLNGGKQSRMTIATDIRASPGFTGFMERLLAPRINRRIYNQELRNLDEYVRRKRA